MYAHANVYNTCLRILRAKGWTLSVEGQYEPEGVSIDPSTLIYRAVRGEFGLIAHNPAELLGLAAVYEYVQPEKPESYWWHVDGPDILRELWDAADWQPAESDGEE